MKYGEWLNEWLENYVKVATKISTYTRYSEIVERHIKLCVGNYEIGELTPIILQKYITKLLKSGNLRSGKALSANSVNAIITVLQGSLRVAYKLGLIENDVATSIIRPKIYEKKVECFTFKEQKTIEKAVLLHKKSYTVGIIICLYTGIRLGELLALEWNDVDFDERLLHIQKSCHNGKRQDGTFGKIIDSPKTASSLRDIPLPKALAPMLKNYKKKSVSKWVIADGKKEILIRRYQRIFSGILKTEKIKPRCFHALRHTFATRALESGMDVKTLSEILGHKSPTVTLNRYAHSMLNHKKNMMDLVGSLLKK